MMPANTDSAGDIVVKMVGSVLPSPVMPLVSLPGFIQAFQERLQLAFMEAQVHKLLLDAKVLVAGITPH